MKYIIGIVFILVILASANIKILSPNELKQLIPEQGLVSFYFNDDFFFIINIGITYSLGDFGYIPYGQTLNAYLFLSNPLDGCQLPEQVDIFLPRTLTKVLLVKRGNCTFGTKSELAERQGFSTLIIVDDKEENILDISMVDKNKTHQINIPTIMIDQKNGDTLIAYQSEHPREPLYISIEFIKPVQTNIVKYQYWMSAMDQDSQMFVQQFKPFQQNMKQQLQFSPHYPLWPCIYCKTQNWTVHNIECLSGGRYCAFDPDNEGPLTGKDVVWQTLRQLCIFDLYPDKWWDYVTQFGQKCLTTNSNGKSRDPDLCSLNIITNVSLNTQKIQECMYSSFDGFNADDIEKLDIQLADNYILARERKIQDILGIQTSPILLVNDQQFKGSLTLNLKNQDLKQYDINHYGPLNMVCSGFSKEQKPQLCKEIPRIQIDENGNIVIKKEENSNWGLWIGSTVLLILAMGLGIFLYRRQMRKAMQKELQLQVNMAISQYFSLNEKEKNFVELK